MQISPRTTRGGRSERLDSTPGVSAYGADMMSTSTADPVLSAPRSAARSRALGPAGTIARILLGGYMVGSVIEAEIADGFTPCCGW